MFESSEIYIDSSLARLGNFSNNLDNNSVNLWQPDGKKFNNQQLFTLAGETIIEAYQNHIDAKPALLYAAASIFNSHFVKNAEIAFGAAFDINKAETLGTEILGGNFGVLPNVQFRFDTEINGALGAYAQSTNTIYINSVFLNQNVDNPTAIGKVLIEETAHFLDASASSIDSPGDEGEILVKLLEGKNLTDAELLTLKQEDDTTFIPLNGNSVFIEQSTTTITIPNATQPTITAPVNSPGSISGSPVVPIDNAGNTRETARNIGTLGRSNSSYSDWVGGIDTNDFYRFYLDNTRNLRLSLSGLSADADVEVLNSSGVRVANGASTNAGSSSETINLNNLSSGTYYTRVYRYSGDTYYNLSLRAEIPDYAGNSASYGVARDITISSSTTTYRDWVGTGDANDYYRLTISGRGTFTLSLNNLTSDADVQVLNSSGSPINSSSLGGTSAESIRTTLSAGTYYVRVYQFSGDTFYNLNLSQVIFGGASRDPNLFAQAFDRINAANNGTYAVNDAYRWGTGWTQEFKKPDGSRLLLMLGDGLNSAQWLWYGNLAEYESLGGAAGRYLDNRWVSLGYPTSDENRITRSDGKLAVWQSFTGDGGKARIHYLDGVGSVATWGAIGSLYTETSGASSWLGMPTRHEYVWQGGFRSDFENGYIFHWNGPTGKAHTSFMLKDVNGTIKAENAVITAQSFEDRLYWGSGSGPFANNNDFTRWVMSNGSEPTVTSTTNMNCWEMVLFSAYKSSLINRSWLTQLYNSGIGNPSAWYTSLVSVMAPSRQVYNFNSWNQGLRRGDIVFFDGVNHVAIATGTKNRNGEDEVISHWTPNNRHVEVTTIRALSNFAGTQRIEFGRPTWNWNQLFV